MTLTERIPSMTDAELASLYANAVRLCAGDGARKSQADLVPALEAEIGARKKVRPASTSASAGTRKRRA
jgi:hypothetical protein